MSVEQHLLFAVLAFEDDLIDLQQLTAACRAWADDKSKPLADLLVERGWVTTEDRRFLEKKAERKLARHQNDPRVTLNEVTRGDICEVLRKEVDDSDVRQSLSSWPSNAPVLLETIGETLDESQKPKTRYTWISEVGAGGLGKVWLARDNDLSREVALKEIKPGTASSEAVRRLIKEAQITGQLQHPGIVPVYEVSREGRPFYTMKLVKGQTLSQAIQEHREQKQAGKEDPLSERRLLNVFLNICDAIAYAHSRGVIHRDLKPDNIVVGEYGEAIVLDWGLARQVSSDDEESAPIVVTEDGRTNATQAGQKLGTPAYMAPEQASGRVEHMDERTDIYGLGAILFELLTGQAPHQSSRHAPSDEASPGSSIKDELPDARGPTGRHHAERDSHSEAPAKDEPLIASGMATLLHRIATGETPRVRSIDQTIPDELNAICATAMAKHRHERYHTVKDLKVALLEFQFHEESIELAANAADDLYAARQSGAYDDFSRAQFGFETALEQWPDNARAVEGLKETRCDYSHAAFDRGDFDLALSLLDAADPDHVALATSIQASLTERTSRANRIRRLRRFGFAASVTIAVLASVAAVWINSERSKALTAQAEEATQRGIAEDERENAVAAQRVAERSAYYSDMLLVQRDVESTNISHLLELLDKHRDRDDLKGFEWGYWDRAVHSDLLTLKGHTNWVWSVTFSPNGQQLASASSDQTVKVWDVATGQESFTLLGHTAHVWSVAFSPDGQRLASASGDQTVKVWDAATGQESLTLKGHTEAVVCVAFSPDGQRLASASADQTVKVWDAATGQESLTLKGHTKQVNSVAFSPDGQRLASAGGYNEPSEVKVWDAATGQETLTLKGHTNYVWGVAFSPDGQWLASASADTTVKVWDAATGQESFTLLGHGAEVWSVAFSPDGQRLASASRDGTVKVWDAATGQESHTLRGHTNQVYSVAFSPNGRRLASASGDQTVKVWDAATRQESLTLKGHTSIVYGVAFSPDRQWLASASGDKTVKVWDAATGQESLTLKGHTEAVVCVAFSPDGQRLASGSDDKTVKVWDAATGQESLTLQGHTSFVWGVAFSPDGQRLASASDDKTVKVWDAATGQESLTLQGHTDLVWKVAFSPDGQRLASASGDKTVKVWDAATGQESLTLKGHTMQVSSVAFSPDGQRLASASWDNTVKVWDAATGQGSLTLKGHAYRVQSVAFSPDGQRLASASSDGTVKVWDAATGQESLTLLGFAGRNLAIMHGVAFSPDGQRLASASSDQTVEVWDARPWTPELRAQSQARGLLIVNRDRVESLEDLQAYIHSDATLSGMVRKQALDWAELFWKNRQPGQN